MDLDLVFDFILYRFTRETMNTDLFDSWHAMTSHVLLPWT